MFMHREISLRLAAAALLGVAGAASADSVPEVLHYRFDSDAVTQANSASMPPVGTETASIVGGHTTNGADLNASGGGFSLVSNGMASSGNYLNTNWVTNLASGTSWTISFVADNVTTGTTTQYVFGDVTAGEFRCFTGGVAGAGNWILRGSNMTDVFANGGAAVGVHRVTFVYDGPGNVVRAYIDGALASTTPQGGPLGFVGTGLFKVAGYSASQASPFAGTRVDDFRVYNRALTAEEVLDIDRPDDVFEDGFEAPPPK